MQWLKLILKETSRVLPLVAKKTQYLVSNLTLNKFFSHLRHFDT